MSDEAVRPVPLVSARAMAGIGALVGFFVGPWVMTHPMITGHAVGSVLYCGNAILNGSIGGALVGGVAAYALAARRS